MKLQSATLLLVLGLAVLLVLTAQQPGESIGWYNGDWQSGIPSPGNWYLDPVHFMRVYDQFQVPAGGWTIVSVFSDNNVPENAVITSVSWEIRRGMSAGNAGELIASGYSPAIQSPDPSIKVPTYSPETVASLLKSHFRIQANSLRVTLAAGWYWISVTPAGVKAGWASSTLGTNAAGVDADGLRPALIDSSSGPHYAIAESAGKTGQVGRVQHCSQGVVIGR